MTGKSTVTSNMISLPKGGGSIGGMGETFTPDAFSGTGNFSVPIGVSPGRDGFSPQLSLNYSTGSGNGPFGMGWQLSAPEVVRSTRKGLPRYTDDDTFMLSGADLVRDTAEEPVTIGEYSVTRFRPRVEGMFARIEHWRKRKPESASSGLSASFWRVTSGDNMTSVFGATAGGVLANPAEKGQIFRWYLELAYDGKGNYIKYTYKPEDNAGIALEQVRQGASSNRYLKRISYGNLTALPSSDASVLTGLLAAERLGLDSLFQVVLDYGEHGLREESEELIAADIAAVSRDWMARSDAFSTCSPGFEVRTSRLCKRILMVHEFPGEQPYLVRSYDFTYAPFKHNGVNSLNRVTQRGYRKSETQVLKQSEESGLGERGVRSYLYEIGSMPPIEFEYSVFEPPLADQLMTLKGEGASRPVGLHDRDCTLIDLFGRGMNDILETRRDGYRYWQNLGRGRFGEMRRLQSAPLNATLSQEGVGLADITGEGYPDIVEVLGNRWGYYPGRMEGGWGSFRPFPSQPDFSPTDPKVTLMDLTGDGTFDALRTDTEAFVIYESAGAQGFGKGKRIPRVHDLRTFPDIDFTDPRVHVADMNGDGLSDIVMIEGDKVHYWPNLGYGKFGARITTQVPGLHFQPDQMSFIDIDGNGPADLVQIESGRVSFWINNSGNGWSARYEMRGTPAVASPESVKISDMMGTGTAGILWSSPAGLEAYTYLPLTSAGKPGLLTAVSSNMGLTTRFSYQASTELALEAERNGKPWTGRLPFPVWVLSRVEKIDHITDSQLATTYEYADGHYDEINREFVGFGRVDLRDAESLGAGDNGNATHGLVQPPVLTRMWYHTGALPGRDIASRQFAGEYYSQNKAGPSLPDSALPPGLSPEEQRDALRSLKGRLLRQEIYGEDDSDRAVHPYTVSEHSYRVRCIQTATATTRAVFSAHDAESVDFHYERNPNDPRMAHQFVLEIDEFDHVTLAATVAYPRRPGPDRHPEQSKMLITAASQLYGQKTDAVNGYRHGAPLEERTFEITGIAIPDGGLLSTEDLRNWIRTAAVINYEEQPTDGVIQKRIIAWSRHVYWDDAAKTALPAGQVGLPALPHNTYEAAFTPGLLERVFGDRLDARVMESEGGYVFDGGIWWRPAGYPETGFQVFDASRFYRPVRTCDPFGNTTTISYDRFALLVEQTTDPLGNVVRAENDYRVLKPSQVTDANGNRQAVAFDAIGAVVGTAVKGKEGERLGDSLDEFTPDLNRDILLRHIAGPLSSPEAILGTATTRVLYDHWRYYRTKERTNATEHGVPIVICTLERETHASDLKPGTQTRIMHRFVYQDGFGRSIQTKVQAEPDSAVPTSPRWVGTGRTIYNNKGKPVKQYEPLFSSTHRFDEESEMVMTGVTPILFYDPVGRLVATLNPNHTYEKVVFDPWQQAAWDVNDTLKLEPQADPDVAMFLASLPEADYMPTWYGRMSASADSDERHVARRTEPHAGTPTVTHVDILGRSFLTVAHNRVRDGGVWRDEKYTTFKKLDPEGQTLWIRDARGNLVMQYISPPVANDQAADPVSGFVTCYGIAGSLLYQHSMDAGDRWIISDATGTQFYNWEVNERVADAGDTAVEHRMYRTTYDALHRPLENQLSVEGRDPKVIQRFVYGESLPEASTRNLRGRVAHHYDQSGRITNDKCDFKGNLLETRRWLAPDYDAPAIDWRGDHSEAGLEGETFTLVTEYDARNRVARLWNWHRSDAHVAVHEPHYNERGLLERGVLAIGASRQGDGTYAGGQSSEVVREIGFNAKGQPERMIFANGTETRYEYERETFRLKRLVTTRNADGSRLQDLRYTYDPVGNITEIRDDAQQTVYFANAVVEPHCRYEYDALYRLTVATGREHAIQNNVQRDNTNYEPGTRIPFLNSPEAMQNYTERYDYDAVGNILGMDHSGGNAQRWKRCYQYALDSNRLLATGRPGDLRASESSSGPNYVQQPTLSARYKYDTHGNVLTLDRSSDKYSLHWDFSDMIHHVNLGGGGQAWYNYDAGKQRTRKIVLRISGAKEERLYLGGIELYRRWSATGELKEEIETHHVEASEQRLLLVDDVHLTDNAELGTGLLYKYQYSNQLGSGVAELDGDARLISYEEYHPYGSTAFSARDASVRTTAKRYRYTGMERDEETGLSYHGARFYAGWLARWYSPDPIGVEGGQNLYCYVQGNPVIVSDQRGLDGQTCQFLHQQLVCTPGRADPNIISWSEMARQREAHRGSDEVAQFIALRAAQLGEKGLEVYVFGPGAVAGGDVVSRVVGAGARQFTNNPRIVAGAEMAGGILGGAGGSAIERTIARGGMRTIVDSALEPTTTGGQARMSPTAQTVETIELGGESARQAAGRLSGARREEISRMNPAQLHQTAADLRNRISRALREEQEGGAEAQQLMSRAGGRAEAEANPELAPDLARADNRLLAADTDRTLAGFELATVENRLTSLGNLGRASTMPAPAPSSSAFSASPLGRLRAARSPGTRPTDPAVQVLPRTRVLY